MAINATTKATMIAKDTNPNDGFRAVLVRRVLRVCVLAMLFAGVAQAQEPPELTAPVNDFAGVIDQSSEAEMEALIRSLQQASGDVVVVATVKTFQPYADIREYAVKMFENGGRGVGQRGKDNGLLVLLAIDDREVWVEVGYDLEEFITDGFAGETSRQYMAPEFRRGEYGAGLLAGVSRIVERIAARRNVTLQGIRRDPARAPDTGSGGSVLVALFVLFMVINALAGMTRRRRRFGRRWGGPVIWNSGVGPFGGGLGGWGGGRSSGGFGGGFGGFGGGRSGGGGGGASW